jgi:hypothetical protein
MVCMNTRGSEERFWKDRELPAEKSHTYEARPAPLQWFKRLHHLLLGDEVSVGTVKWEY